MTKIIFAISTAKYFCATSKFKTKQAEEVYYHITADNNYFADL